VLTQRRAGSYNPIQFTQIECAAVDQIFVAESLLEGARDCSEGTNDEFVRTGGEMIIAALVLLTMLTGSAQADRSNCGPMNATQQSNGANGQINGNQIKISIATGGGPYGPAKDSYRVGERIPVVITMTNTGTEPAYVCQTGALYQDRPKLLKDGKPVPYMSFQQSSMQLAEADKTCDQEDLPQQVLLRPNEPTVVDWFVLSKAAAAFNDVAWYEPLQPGKYTLSDRRRLSCCDGDLIETNTINFVVVP
jgi:hypothetical protein